MNNSALLGKIVHPDCEALETVLIKFMCCLYPTNFVDILDKTLFPTESRQNGQYQCLEVVDLCSISPGADPFMQEQAREQGPEYESSISPLLLPGHQVRSTKLNKVTACVYKIYFSISYLNQGSLLTKVDGVYLTKQIFTGTSQLSHRVYWTQIAEVKVYVLQIFHSSYCSIILENK